MNDIDISRRSKKLNITDIADSIGIDSDNIEVYGKYKAKIKSNDAMTIRLNGCCRTP